MQFALEHLQHGLDRDPNNLEILRETGIYLQRLALAGVPGQRSKRFEENTSSLKLSLEPNFYFDQHRSTAPPPRCAMESNTTAGDLNGWPRSWMGLEKDLEPHDFSLGV